MDIREKLMDEIVYMENYSKTVDVCETICDEFAIGFAYFLIENTKDKNRLKELLQIYKDIQK